MLLFYLYLVIFCMAFSKAHCVLDEKYMVLESDVDELRWADTYKVKATRVSLTSNIVEDYTAWYDFKAFTHGEDTIRFKDLSRARQYRVEKTNQSSRVDYNKGAVKDITLFGEELPLKYQIHPETTEEVLNAIVCHFIYDVLFDDNVTLDAILPDLTEDEFEAVGNETVNEVSATKFVNKYVKFEDDIRKAIWAAYDDYFGWVPIKYEVKKYNNVLGSLVDHDIWTFSDYDPDFSDEDVFDTDKYGCEDESAVKLSADSEKITKELIFVNPDNKKHLSYMFNPDNKKHLSYMFNHFKNKYHRNYAHDKEHALRKSIFDANVRLISSVNRQNLTYKLGINQFSDWTPEEIKKSLGAIPRPEGREATVAFPYEERDLHDIVKKLPKEFDMRVLGLISPVKDQGDCGSCWTFAAAAATESGLARINGGRVLSLSNQAIIDCAYEYLGDAGAGGCNGGFDFAAYDFIVAHGLPTDEEYGPYKNRDGYCNIGNMTKTYSITGYTQVTKYNFNAMKVAVVNHGPLFVYVHVSDEFFKYSRGIFYQTNKKCNPERPNHAVALVGYGEMYGDLFWILKNSWGVNWGIDGYMLIAAKDNVCGVSANPTYPVF